MTPSLRSDMINEVQLVAFHLIAVRLSFIHSLLTYILLIILKLLDKF